MEHLYIIGNGFDQHHNIPCGYLAYKKWLLEHDFSTFSSIEEYYGIIEDDWWSNFEVNLSELADVDSFIQTIIEDTYVSPASDEWRDRDWYNAEVSVENELGYLVENIKASFNKWVLNLPDPDIKKKVSIEYQDSFFISFNYTNTLESIYGIDEDRILYIHGKANRDNELVLGHGKSEIDIRKDLLPTEPQPNNNLSDDEYIDYQSELDNHDTFIEDRAYESAIHMIASLRKDVDSICHTNKELFHSFRGVKYLHIFGFSFSEIDLPYLRKILRITGTDNILVEASYFEEGDDKIFRRVLQDMNIPDNHITIIRLNEIICK